MSQVRRRGMDSERRSITADQSEALDALRKRVAELEDRLRQQRERLEQVERLADLALECHEDGFTILKTLTDRFGASGPSEVERSPYGQLVVDVTTEITRHVPRGSVVLVVSKGDPALVRLPARVGWHFPRTADGAYPGFHPHSSTTAIAALEALRAQGADYLVLPCSAFWWMDHYEEFFLHIERHYRLVADLDVCRIHSLRACPLPGTVNVRAQLARILAEAVACHDGLPTVLDWTRVGVGPLAAAQSTVAFDASIPLPFIDRSFDLVVTDSSDGAAQIDARRVADLGVVIVSNEQGSDGHLCEVQWRTPLKTHGRSVSVIVAADGGPGGEACLQSVADTLPDYLDVEVIVIARGEDADAVLSSPQWRHPRHRLQLASAPPMATTTAARSCGAELATKEILVFVDGGTLLLPDWLPPLLRVLQDFERAGAVAPLELAPDGRLLSAGSIMFRDGSALHLGRDDHKMGSAGLAHVRPVDIVSAGVLATPRRAFDAAGQFPTTYAQAAYTDADYCFALRSAGRLVYCQPESVVVRPSDPSTGTFDPAASADQSAFVKRWHEALRSCPVGPPTDAGAALTLALHIPTDLSEAAAV